MTVLCPPRTPQGRGDSSLCPPSRFPPTHPSHRQSPFTLLPPQAIWTNIYLWNLDKDILKFEQSVHSVLLRGTLQGTASPPPPFWCRIQSFHSFAEKIKAFFSGYPTENLEGCEGYFAFAQRLKLSPTALIMGPWLCRLPYYVTFYPKCLFSLEISHAFYLFHHSYHLLLWKLCSYWVWNSNKNENTFKQWSRKENFFFSIQVLFVNLFFFSLSLKHFHFKLVKKKNSKS